MAGQFGVEVGIVDVGRHDGVHLAPSQQPAIGDQFAVAPGVGDIDKAQVGVALRVAVAGAALERGT